jgi:DNA-binding NarL/FixJ family response regulator
VADDSAEVRAVLHSLLTRELGWQIVGEAANGFDALTLCARLQPDLVLMDVHMPAMDGLRATRAIKTEWPAIKVVIMTSDSHDSIRQAASEAGADGFVIKSVNAANFLAAIRSQFRSPNSTGQ